MNCHIPQSIQTAVELKYLAAVSRMIISPSENKPIISPAQDNLLGMFKITDDNVFFSQQEVMNMLVGIEKFNGTIPEPKINDGKIMKWTGKQIYSIILPPITYYQKSKKPAIKDLIIDEASRKALKSKSRITMNMIEDVIKTTKPSVPLQELEKYEKIRSIMNGENTNDKNNRRKIGF